MNKETFYELQKSIPGFEKKYVHSVPISQIEFDDYNSQVRQKGHVIDKVPAFAHMIKAGQWLPPITVRSLPNGKLELKEGATRVLGHMMAGQEHILSSDYHDRVRSFTQDEWFDWQCEANNHPVQTANSKDDIKYQIQKRVNNGAITRRLGFKYHDKPIEWLEDASKYLKDIYSSSGLTKKQLKNILKNCCGGAIAKTYEAYTKQTAMEKFKNINELGWTTDKTRHSDAIGDICANVCVFACANIPQLKTNAFANAAYKKIDNPTVKMYIVCYVGDLTGKNDEALAQARKKSRVEYKKINKAYNIFAGIYFLPQIKTGKNKEDLYKLIK